MKSKWTPNGVTDIVFYEVFDNMNNLSLSGTIERVNWPKHGFAINDRYADTFLLFCELGW